MKNSKINVGLVALLMSTGLLVGCNSGPNIGPEEKPHEHALVSVDAKDATYYKEGNIKYYYCPECNKKFSDSTGTTEISDADVILKKKTILEETTEAQKEDVELVLQQTTVTNGTSKFVSLEGGEVDTGLYVSNNKQGDYTTISLSLSGETSDVVAFEFDYRYLDNCNDREYDMLGHNYISTIVGGESSFVPHTNGKLNKDCAWHTFSYHEENNLGDNITAFEIKIYHFDGELVINNVYVIHEVERTTGDPSTVAHYEDLEGGVYYYDYDNDEYTYVGEKDVTNITKIDGLQPSCDPGYEDYYFCEYTREYYEDKDGNTVIEDIDAWKAPGGGGYLAPTHTLTKVDGQAATCTEAGYMDAYTCQECNRYYADSEGLNLIGDAEAYYTWKTTGAGKIAALDHKWLEAYESDDTHHWHKCERCGDVQPDSKVAHTFDQEVEDEAYLVGEASCTEPATYYKSCVCGKAGTETFTSGTPLGHYFDETGECTRCDANVKSYLDLEDASRSDLINQISLSNLKINGKDFSQYVQIPDQSSGHIFGTCDVSGGVDLTYNFKFDKASGSYHNIYLGNGGNEYGLQIRFMTETDDTKHVSGYFYSTTGELIKGDGTPFYNGTDSTSHFYVKTAAIGAERKLEIKLVPVADPVVDGYDMYKLTVFADGVQFHKEAEVLTPIEDLYVGFPENYFEGGSNNQVRFSYEDNNNTDGKAYIKDAEVSNPNELIMLDGNGNVLGKKSDFTNPITLPELHKENNKFVGWFDETGEKLTTVSSVSKKTIVKPVFVESQVNMYVPSDFKYSTKGATFTPTLGQEYYVNQINENLPEGASRIDTYFIVKPTLVTPDEYFFFGIPFSNDGKNRVSVRVSLTPTNTWYWNSSSTTIGGAGAAGTSFKPSDEGLTWTSGTNYLFHCYIENTNDQEKPFRFGFDVTNLADFTTYSSYKDFKFNEDTGYTIGDKDRSKLYFYMPADFGTKEAPSPATATFSVTDAW